MCSFFPLLVWVECIRKPIQFYQYDLFGFANKRRTNELEHMFSKMKQILCILHAHTMPNEWSEKKTEPIEPTQNITVPNQVLSLLQYHFSLYFFARRFVSTFVPWYSHMIPSFLLCHRPSLRPASLPLIHITFGNTLRTIEVKPAELKMKSHLPIKTLKWFGNRCRMQTFFELIVVVMIKKKLRTHTWARAWPA